MTTKAEPIFCKFKVLGGFCVSSSLMLAQIMGMGVSLKNQATFIDFILKEWPVIASGVGLT
ncbi:MAG: hypothetical protein J7L16_03465, partial [Deltaproteobacteria bacterium]|nr:hypothetical protein [Deltaproteobacteria bacterium]